MLYFKAYKVRHVPHLLGLKIKHPLKSHNSSHPLTFYSGPDSVFLPGESQGQRSLVGCCLWGRQGLDMTEAAADSVLKTLHVPLSFNPPNNPVLNMRYTEMQQIFVC